MALPNAIKRLSHDAFFYLQSFPEVFFLVVFIILFVRMFAVYAQQSCQFVINLMVVAWLCIMILALVFITI
ncbi:hypothetical protein TH468_09410 [Thalassospira sp. MCCC 1A03138]|nr:hypothetical protein TH468_09410 [Thalassospira sp. MCCC 1A03138]